MLSMYPACFYKEAEGYSVVFPDLNNLATQGDTFEEAMEMAVDCLAGYLYTCKRDGETPDEPFPEAFVNVVSVDVAEYAKQHFERSVKKTLSIPSWLNDAAMAQGINFSCVLQQALKEQLHMA